MLATFGAIFATMLARRNLGRPRRVLSAEQMIET
jgi:hypothetical protein